MSNHTAKLDQSVALVGMMGVGKTSIGKRLAPLLGMPFFDTDSEIEVAAEMKIADIFENYGETEFRRLEGRVIARILKAGPCVMATGGGAWVQGETQRVIQQHAVSIWLDAEVTTLIERTKGRTHRPLLNVEDPAQILRDLKIIRDPLYAQADIHVTSSNARDENGTVKDLMPLIKEHLAK